MASEARQAVADRTALEILCYVMDEIWPKLDLSDESVWQSVAEADRALTQALGAYPRGEITLNDLERIGTEYVEAWQRSVTPVPSPAVLATSA